MPVIYDWLNQSIIINGSLLITTDYVDCNQLIDFH